MKVSDAVKILNQPTGDHLDKIYIPSAGREICFTPLTTADVKTLTRMNFLENFDLSIEGLKLGLFDKLCAEDLSDTVQLNENNEIIHPMLSSKTITQIDYLAFLIGIRQLLRNDVVFTFTCNTETCKQQFEHTLHLDQEFEENINNFSRKRVFFEKVDERTSNIWKFELTNYTMENYLYFRYFITRLSEVDAESPEVSYETKYVKPILYIKNIWLNDELIEDWPSLSLPEKLSFYNKIPPDITINTIGTKNDTIFNFIRLTFDEELLEEKINNMTVTCPHCQTVYGGVFSFDNFFMF